LATKPRGWTGARTPSAIKRVRTAERRTEINKPRRSAAKTYTAKALKVATQQIEGDPQEALAEALSALDRAAKAGAIHPNAAARRKSRLTRKVNAALGGESVQTSARLTKTTGKAAAAKAAKARVAASKAVKAKGAQTAAGKARAALSKTARAESAAAAKAAAATAATATPDATAKATTKAATSKAATSKAATTKGAPAKSTAKTTAKPATAKSTTPKATAKPAAKPATKSTTRATKPKATDPAS
jgi:DNA-binding protein HU-beta